MPWPASALTMQPVKEAVRLQTDSPAQGTRDNGLVALEVVHGACIKFMICAVKTEERIISSALTISIH